MSQLRSIEMAVAKASENESDDFALDNAKKVKLIFSAQVEIASRKRKLELEYDETFATMEREPKELEDKKVEKMAALLRPFKVIVGYTGMEPLEVARRSVERWRVANLKPANQALTDKQSSDAIDEHGNEVRSAHLTAYCSESGRQEEFEQVVDVLIGVAEKQGIPGRVASLRRSKRIIHGEIAGLATQEAGGDGAPASPSGDGGGTAGGDGVGAGGVGDAKVCDS